MASVTRDTSQLSLGASTRATTAMISMMSTFENSVSSTDVRVLKTVSTQMADVIGNLLKSSNNGFESTEKKSVREREDLGI